MNRPANCAREMPRCPERELLRLLLPSSTAASSVPPCLHYYQLAKFVFPMVIKTYWMESRLLSLRVKKLGW